LGRKNKENWKIEMISQEYLEWVKQADLPLLTNTQHQFAEWLLEEENAKMLMKIGDLDKIFISVRKHLKNNGSFKEHIVERNQ
jgi:predicted TPR repeat methyltransferase